MILTVRADRVINARSRSNTIQMNPGFVEDLENSISLLFTFQLFIQVMWFFFDHFL